MSKTKRSRARPSKVTPGTAKVNAPHTEEERKRELLERGYVPGIRLKVVRLLSGWTVQLMSSHSGYRPKWVEEAETFGVAMWPDEVKKLANRIGVDPYWLVGYTRPADVHLWRELHNKNVAGDLPNTRRLEELIAFDPPFRLRNGSYEPAVTGDGSEAQ